MQEKNEVYDLIVIGKGPSAITCGIYTLRANMKVLSIGKDFGSMKDTICDNYYAKYNTTLKDIAKDGMMQFERLGGDVLTDEVVDVDYDGKNYIIQTIRNGKYYTKRIFLGIGIRRNNINIPDIKKYEGKGVSYCSICDSFLYKGKDIVLVSKEENLEIELDILTKNVAKIYIITKEELEEKRKSDIIKKYNSAKCDIVFLREDISKIIGEETIEQVILSNDRKLFVSAIFVAYGISTNMLKAKFNLKLDNGYIQVDENRRTSIKNIYAGGDIVKGIKQVTKACYDGMIAAYYIIRKGNEEK